MKPSIVVDIGNSRAKWGLCLARADSRQPNSTPALPDLPHVSLPHDDVAAWERQLVAWNLGRGLAWAVSSVNPAATAVLAKWAHQRGDSVWVLENCRDLPLEVKLEHPERVGMDRLLDAVAAKAYVPGGTPAVIVDAGTAVTVDFLDESGAFAGGAIFPGLRLMARALHDHTALLPVIETPTGALAMPGTTTPDAMAAGVFWAVIGGIQSLTEQLSARSHKVPRVFLTGGDAAVLHASLTPSFVVWPTMTLEGLRLTAEAKA